MLEFSGQNFQSWPNFKIQVEGLTVITGETNLGKSSVFRALRGILRNEISQAAVKTGTEECALDLNLDGLSIKFNRSAKGSAEYVIGKKRYAKLAGQIPPEIQALGFNEIQIGTFKFDPVFAGQFDSPFLLKSSPQELNAVLGAFASTEKLEFGKKQAALQITQKNQEAKALASEIGEAEERRSRLDELQAKVEAVAEALPTLENEAARLSHLSINLRAAILQRRLLEPIQAILAKLELPDFTEADQLVALTNWTERVLGARCSLRQSTKTLNVCDEINASWTEIISDYRTYSKLHEAIEAKTSKARTIAKELNNVIGQIEEFLPRAEDLQGRIKQIRTTIDFYALTRAARERLAVCELEGAGLEDRVDELQADIDEAADSGFIECPKCHHKFAVKGHECCAEDGVS